MPWFNQWKRITFAYKINNFCSPRRFQVETKGGGKSKINKQANKTSHVTVMKTSYLSWVFSIWALTAKEIKRSRKGVNNKWPSLHGWAAVQHVTRKGKNIKKLMCVKIRALWASSENLRKWQLWRGRVTRASEVPGETQRREDVGWGGCRRGSQMMQDRKFSRLSRGWWGAWNRAMLSEKASKHCLQCSHLYGLNPFRQSPNWH